MKEAGMNLCKFKSNLGEIEKQNVTESNEKIENFWAKSSGIFGIKWDQTSDNYDVQYTASDIR